MLLLAHASALSTSGGRGPSAARRTSKAAFEPGRGWQRIPKADCTWTHRSTMFATEVHTRPRILDTLSSSQPSVETQVERRRSVKREAED